MRLKAGSALGALFLLAPAAALAQSDTAGKSTVQQSIVGGDRSAGFATLSIGPGKPYVIREEIVKASAGREARRRSLAYFGQLTDFQLADEESPARVEFLDAPGPTSAAWRPQEALAPQAVDASIRQMNAFGDASPVPQGDGARAAMGFTITTGDSADSVQLNEVQWVVRLLEGGSLNPNSGVDDVVACPGTPPGEAANYTGVQDYDDYPPGNTEYYDPDDPQASWSSWPQYPGLLDRAQQTFTATGLKVKSYVTFGNHDGLVQGNQAAQESFETLGTGCTKPTAGTGLGSPPASVMPVPADPGRQFVNKKQYKAQHATGAQADAHGFAFVDPAEESASNGAAGYYAFEPVIGFRFIGLDTVSDAGQAPVSAEGNIDDPQFKWLEGQLAKAKADGKLVVLFGHHPVRSLRADIPDEQAPPCSSDDAHGHDRNPGCDVDPRSSEPIHLGQDLAPGDPRESLVELLERYPNVIAFVAGHTHENKITPFKRADGSGWWGIETAAEADWPVQHRVLEVMDNGDGTLSIFGTAFDNASPTAIPPSGPATAFDVDTLAAIHRTLAYNDPQLGGGTGEGLPEDQNVELLLPDPRRLPAGGGAPPPPPPPSGPCARVGPLTRIERGTLRRGRRSLSVRGTSQPRRCGRRGEGAVRRVEVAVARRDGRRCRFLRGRRFGRPTACTRRRFNRARGTTAWRYSVRARLPRGRYLLWARGVGTDGAVERMRDRRNRLAFRIR